MLSKKEFDDREIGNRLAELRTNIRPKLTQDKLYVELRNIIAKREGTIPEKENVNGDKVISKIENGYGLSLKYALAYAEYFNVSLEYIYFGAKSYKPSYDDIKELTGLSDDALNILEKLKNDKTFIFVLNNFLGPNLSSYFINLLHSYFDYYNLNVKSKEMNNEYIKYIKSKGAKIKNVDNFSWEFYPKERDYTCLYKISTESNELAEKFKKSGGK